MFGLEKRLAGVEVSLGGTLDTEVFFLFILKFKLRNNMMLS